jgi:hypothetical protein
MAFANSARIATPRTAFDHFLTRFPRPGRQERIEAAKEEWTKGRYLPVGAVFVTSERSGPVLIPCRVDLPVVNLTPFTRRKRILRRGDRPV